MRAYLLKDGREIFVSCGISNGSSWFTAYRKPSGSTKRFVSKELPERITQSFAQADLELYANKNKLMLIDR